MKPLTDNSNRRSFTRNDLEVFNYLQHPVWAFDIQNKCMWFANETALDLWNADSLESLQNRDFTDMSAASEQRLQENLLRFQKGETVSESWTFYPKNQGAKSCYVTMSGMYVTEEQTERIVMLVEGELMKETTDQSALRGVEMLRHLPVPVGQFSEQGKVMDQNPEALRVFGGSSSSPGCKRKHSDRDQEQRTECCLLIERFVDKHLGKQVFRKVVEEGMDYDGEVQQHTKQGIRWFAVQLRRSKDPVSGSPVVLYSARDITARIDATHNMTICVNAKRRADEDNRAKSEFMAVLSHEIRTPLHQVVGFLELLAQTSLTASQADYVSLMENSAASLMTVINDLLDFTKLEAGKMKMERISFSVRDLVTDAVASIRPKATPRGLEVSSSIAENLPQVVLGDPNRLRQVLFNLSNNAVKFTRQGRVRLSVHAVNRIPRNHTCRLRFVVSDTGIGIPPEDQKDIFQKYRQANASISRKFGGTGLGLAICKIIVETMGGSIGLDSVVEQGSKFWFELPFETVSSSSQHSDTACSSLFSSLETQPVPGLKILVAEDNKVNQKLVVAVLKRLGHVATVVETGLQAVQALEKDEYNLVLMDVQMPEMDGIEATRVIRKNGWTVPVLGLTADFRPANRSQYQAIGMNDCLAKPVRMDDLGGTIRNVMLGTTTTTTTTRQQDTRRAPT